jgi:hypothetical protein
MSRLEFSLPLPRLRGAFPSPYPLPARGEGILGLPALPQRPSKPILPARGEGIVGLPALPQRPSKPILPARGEGIGGGVWLRRCHHMPLRFPPLSVGSRRRG